jgi:AbrB family looped-hinge helix DNA binding protein
LTPTVYGASLTGKTYQETTMQNTATTTWSSKGQVVIPEEIRVRLGLKAGAQFVVVGDRDTVILKVLEPPSLKEFQGLMAQARKAAKHAGLKRADVAKATAKVRRAK